MKKILLSIAILASSVVAFAQDNAQSTTSTPQVKTEQTKSDNNKGKKAGRKGKKGFKDNDSKGGRAFEGINLTEEQKTKLTALRTTLKDERKDGKEKAGKDRTSQMTPDQKKALRAERSAKRQAAKRAYLAGVKEILTPDQYVLFLENTYTLSAHGPKSHHNGKAIRGDKSGKKDNRGNKTAPRNQKRKTADKATA